MSTRMKALIVLGAGAMLITACSSSGGSGRRGGDYHDLLGLAGAMGCSEDRVIRQGLARVYTRQRVRDWTRSRAAAAPASSRAICRPGPASRRQRRSRSAWPAASRPPSIRRSSGWTSQTSQIGPSFEPSEVLADLERDVEQDMRGAIMAVERLDRELHDGAPSRWRASYTRPSPR